MAVTRSTAAERTRHSTPFTVRTAAYRTRELIGLVAASLLVVAGVYLAYQGRVARLETPAPGPFDLTQLDRREQLLPYLTLVSSPVERQYVARKIADGLRDRGGEVPNVGTLARIRVPIREVLATKGLVELQTRAKELVTADKDAATLTLLTPAQVSRLKPLFVVRPLDTYRNKLILWTAVFLAMFYAGAFLLGDPGLEQLAVGAAGPAPVERHRPGADDQPARSLSATRWRSPISCRASRSGVSPWRRPACPTTSG